MEFLRIYVHSMSTRFASTMMLYGCPERMRVLPHPPMQLRIGEFLVDDLVKLMAVQFIYLELGLLGLILKLSRSGQNTPRIP